MPKQNPKTHMDILSAAEEVFAHKGYGGARTAEIAKAAGVNKALIHYYFTSKEQLYHEVMDRLLFDFIQISQDMLKQGLAGRELVEGLFDALFNYAAKHKHFARLTTVESAGGQSRYVENMLRNFFKPLFDRAVDFIISGQSKGEIKSDVDARQFIITIYLAILEYFTDSRFIAGLLSRDPTSKKILNERKAHLKRLLMTTLYKG